MIDKQYNNKTIFAIKTKNDEVHYLQLSPDNYQQQFVQYLREKKISRDDAYELKQLIQKSIREKAEEKRLLFLRQEQKIKNQLIEWQKKPIINKQTSLDQQIFNNNNPTQPDMKKQEHIIDENNKNVLKQYCASPSNKNLLQNPLNSIVTQKSEYGVQVQIQINHPKENQNPIHPPNKTEQIKPEVHIQKINLNKDIISNSFNEQMPKQFSLKMSFGQQQQHSLQTSPLFNSPRFKQVDSQNQQVDQHHQIVTQQQIEPRKTPQMHSVDKFQSLYESFQKSTEANSPEAFDKSNNEKMKGENQKKKILLLQNYKKSATKNKLNTSKCSSSSSPLSKSSHSGKKKIKIVYDPQISKRLFENQTACFKNKQLQEFNTHEQRDYIEYLQYLEHVPRLIIHQFQDMSAKTTKSFRAKHQPQPNLKQIQEQQDYQRSFQEHLIAKRLERQRKQKLKKQKQGQNFEFKGPHCEQKIIREQMEKMKVLKEQKQKQIRQRISKQIKQNKHKNLAERSCSPASLSRGCPCCKPVSPARSKQKLHIMKANIGKSNKNNVKYLNNLIQQTRQQFIQGFKK